MSIVASFVAGERVQGTLWTFLNSTEDRDYGVFRCDCGMDKRVYFRNIKNGYSKSCGCRRSIVSKSLKLVHGRKNTAEYRIWRNMKNRCLNSKVPCFSRYGWRGISVCDRWSNSFLAFFEDMGDRPSPEHTLDRIDNDGNYEPGNCRWATATEQGRNTRSNVLLTLDGVTMTMIDWSEKTGISETLLSARLKRLKWTVREALTTPVKR